MIGPLTTDYQFRWIIEWMFDQDWIQGDTIESKLGRLNGRMFTSLTVLPRLRNKLVHQYLTRKDAIDCYIGTGTFFGTYQNSYVVDGGLSNGKPAFTDGRRAQIFVEPLKSKLPSKFSHIMSYDIDYAKLAFELGQNDVVKFLRNPQSMSKAIYHYK